MENFDLLPPSKLRMEKWHVLPFARLHPCFREDGGLLFYFILSTIVQLLWLRGWVGG